jgi:hypothetical protein
MTAPSFLDLSHVIKDGLVTCKGLSAQDQRYGRLLGARAGQTSMKLKAKEELM